MQIFVKNLQGRDVTFVVQPSITVADLKVMIFEDKTRVTLPENVTGPDDLRLLFSGKQLEDAPMLGYYEIEPNSTLHLVLRLRGGAKKGCKKTITKGERIAALTAKTHYLRTHVQEPNYTAIIDRVSVPGYTQWAIGIAG